MSLWTACEFQGRGGRKGNRRRAVWITVLRVCVRSPLGSFVYVLGARRAHPHNPFLSPCLLFHKFILTLMLSTPTYLLLLMCFMSVFYTFWHHLDLSGLHWSRHWSNPKEVDTPFKPFQRNSYPRWKPAWCHLYFNCESAYILICHGFLFAEIRSYLSPWKKILRSQRQVVCCSFSFDPLVFDTSSYLNWYLIGKWKKE